MSYKTILVHLDNTERCAERVRVASNLALRYSAHLVGLACVGSVYVPSPVGGVVGESYIRDMLELQRKQAREALQAFEAQAKKIGVASVECRQSEREDEDAVVLHSRYADLVVIGQTDEQDGVTRIRRDFPQQVMMSAGRPVLVVPYAGRFDKVGQNVLATWNASLESARAITDALPLLRDAKLVRVAVFNADSDYKGHGDVPGADIALHLSRHGVKVELCQETTDIEIGAALLSRAADWDSDLIVMGGYGHSRMRELLVGGVTRTLLSTMTVPVLMSH